MAPLHTKQPAGQPACRLFRLTLRHTPRRPSLRVAPSCSKVSLFLEALLSRCASDVLSGRGEEKSPPLRLLSDASFYEMEAVAQSGQSVLFYAS